MDQSRFLIRGFDNFGYIDVGDGCWKPNVLMVARVTAGNVCDRLGMLVTGLIHLKITNVKPQHNDSVTDIVNLSPS